MNKSALENRTCERRSAERIIHVVINAKAPTYVNNDFYDVYLFLFTKKIFLMLQKIAV